MDIIRSGDVVQDAAIYYENISDQKSDILNQFDLGNSKFILCTIHLQENTDDQKKLIEIISAFNDLSKEYRIVESF